MAAVVKVEWIPYSPKDVPFSIQRKPEDVVPDYDPTLWSKVAPTFANDKQVAAVGDNEKGMLWYPEVVVTLAGTVRPGESILDIGCCGGYYSEAIERFALKDFQYTGLDVTPEYIEAARQKYPQRKWVLGDARDLPFPDRSFDHSLCLFLLIHLDVDGVRRVIDGLTRVTRKQVFFSGYFADVRLNGRQAGSDFIYDVVGLGELVRPGWNLHVLKDGDRNAASVPADVEYANGAKETRDVAIPTFSYARLIRCD